MTGETRIDWVHVNPTFAALLEKGRQTIADAQQSNQETRNIHPYPEEQQYPLTPFMELVEFEKTRTPLPSHPKRKTPSYIDTLINHNSKLSHQDLTPHMSSAEAAIHWRGAALAVEQNGGNVTIYHPRRHTVENKEGETTDIYQRFISAQAEDGTTTWFQVNTSLPDLTNIHTIRLFAPPTEDLLLGNIHSDEAQGYLQSLRSLEPGVMSVRVVGLFERPLPQVDSSHRTIDTEQLRIACSRFFGKMWELTHPETAQTWQEVKELRRQKRQWISRNLPILLRERLHQFVGEHTLQDTYPRMYQDDNIIIFSGKSMEIFGDIDTRTGEHEIKRVYVYPAIHHDHPEQVGYLVSTSHLMAGALEDEDVLAELGAMISGRIEGICSHCQLQGMGQKGDEPLHSYDHLCGWEFNNVVVAGLAVDQAGWNPTMIAVILDDMKGHGGVFHTFEPFKHFRPPVLKELDQSPFLQTDRYSAPIFGRLLPVLRDDYRRRGGNKLGAEILVAAAREYASGNPRRLHIHTANKDKQHAAQQALAGNPASNITLGEFENPRKTFPGRDIQEGDLKIKEEID